MKEEKLLAHDPLSDTDAILSEDFYGRSPRELDAEADAPARRPGRLPRATTAREPKPTHYKVICISMYTRDLEELDAKVAELKRRGWTKANKSQLIRLALASLDLDKLPTPQQ
ncbi:MAG: hypothetical protein K8W52_12475 [Deltaproteobacteria bacterium]|nr:hypothetical protein [Deltaproteobacteria bacterium]